MNVIRGLVLTALLGGFAVAHAQLKPSGPGTLPLPAPSIDLKKQDAQGAKELAARAAAETWLAVLDAGEFGKAWDQGAKLFRERVPRERWMEQLPKDRSVGRLVSRRAEVTSYKPSLPGVPDGDYVSIRFSSNFEKKNDAEELLTMTYEGGVWRVLGYALR